MSTSPPHFIFSGEQGGGGASGEGAKIEELLLLINNNKAQTHNLLSRSSQTRKLFLANISTTTAI